MPHSWQLMVKDQSILQFREQPGWGHHLWPSTHIQGARKLWEKGSEKISIRILQCWVVGASGAAELHSAISQPNAGTWKFEPITSYPWLGNRMNKKWRRWQFWQVPEQNGSRENNQKNASNVTFLHPLRLWERRRLLKEKPLLPTTFCQDEKSSHAIPFLQSSCAGKAPFFPMILVCFDWCLWKSLNSVRLSRVGLTNLAQKCQASINYHVSVSISAQCLDWKESRWIKQTLNSY